MQKIQAVFIALLLAAAAGIAWWWWQGRHAAAPVAELPPVVAQAASQPETVAPPPEAAAPAVRHPIEAAASAAAVAPAAAAAPVEMSAALVALFGREAVASWLVTDDFIRHVVATVDNLGRDSASVRLWPVQPTPGRFTVADPGGSVVIGADNAMRYAPFLKFLEGADLKAAVALYVRRYPDFQAAYENLGYPGRPFNDRLVEVIDLLLATPDVPEPVAVHLPPIQGPYKPVRPWVLYEYDDAALQSLAAGQKIVLRMGAANAQRVKARLAALRALVAPGAGATR